MKVVITGSLGHIGKPLTQELVQQGHSVTVISSKPEKQKDIEVLGATAAMGSLEDVNFLVETIKGENAINTMIQNTIAKLSIFSIVPIALTNAAHVPRTIKSSAAETRFAQNNGQRSDGCRN